MVMTGDRMLTVKETADRLSVHPNTVFAWLKRGELKGYRLGGWRIRESDLEQFIQAHANTGGVDD